VDDESGLVEEPVYLILEDILGIYAAIIRGTAAQAADHLRSRDALEGALARPEHYAHYQHADLALQAAVLAHGIAETQPFIDGNKRTALVAMLTFLEINGCYVRATDRELADWIISLNRCTTPKSLAQILPDRLSEIGPGG
jgi:death-on-curing protein